MIPKIECRVCSSELQIADNFCGSCGAEIEWENARVYPPVQQPVSEWVRCELCGNHNHPGAAFCESCGNALRPAAGVLQAKGREKEDTRAAVRPRSSKTFQSWKAVLGVAVLLVVIVFVAKTMRSTTTQTQPSAAPAVSEEMVQQIQSLEKTVNANPNDTQALLQLANRLHDARLFSRSIAMYNRYLDLNPSDPDARVDLGISYFELAVTDTARHAEYLNLAEQEMNRALQFAPKHQLAHFNLGIVSLHAGNIAKANEWFKKCVAIDSASETGRKAQMLINQHTFTQPSSQ